MKKLSKKQLEAEIDRIYATNCSGIQIDIFDISRLFDVGAEAYAEGRDMKAAIVDFVQTIRKN